MYRNQLFLLILISSIDGNKAISLGIKDVDHDAEIVTLSLADGREGTMEEKIQGVDFGYYR